MSARSRHSSDPIGVELFDVSVRIGAVGLLDGLTAEAPAGRTTAVLGASGAGKTTMLRVIAGLIRPASGSVRIGGEEMGERPPAARDVGFVFQEPTLLPHLSLERNIGLPLWARGEKPEAVARAVREIAGSLGIAELLERRPKAVSGGQAQRAAVARALVGRERLLLLDEAFSGLDEAHRRRLGRDVIRAARERAATVVLVTHDQETALSLADQIVVMAAGRALQQGPPAEVFERPAHLSVARLVGRPPINVLETVPETLREHAPEGSVLAFRPTDVDMLEAPDGGPYVEGLRAETSFLGDRYESFYRVGEGEVRVVSSRPPGGERAVLGIRRLHRFDRASGARR